MAVAVESAFEPVFSGIEAAGVLLGVVVGENVLAYGSPERTVVGRNGWVAEIQVGCEAEVFAFEGLIGISPLCQAGELGRSGDEVGRGSRAVALPGSVGRAVPVRLSDNMLMRKDRDRKG